MLARCRRLLHRAANRPTSQRISLYVGAALLLLLACANQALAHGVAEGDKGYIQEISGTHLLPFTYLGAKHMVTGYDHLLFLAGVIFFLYQLKGIALYVSLFAVGHSVTMVYSVCAGLMVIGTSMTNTTSTNSTSPGTVTIHMNIGTATRRWSTSTRTFRTSTIGIHID